MKKILLSLLLLLNVALLFSQVQFLTSGYTSDVVDNGLVTGNTNLLTGVYKKFDIKAATNANFITESPDGKIYGICLKGGTNSRGLFFSVNPNGSNFTVLFNVPASKTISDLTNLVVGSDGKIYTEFSKTLYSIDPNGGGTEVAILSDLNSTINSEGYLAIDNNDWIYGFGVSSSNNFVFYKVKKEGTNYQVLHQVNFSTEGFPTSALCITPTGRLFGQSLGGTNGGGVFFSFRNDGSDYKIEHSFYASTSADYSAYGSYIAKLPPLNVGNKIYLATSSGGPYFNGSLLAFDTSTSALSNTYNVFEERYQFITNPIIVNGKLYALNRSGLCEIDPNANILNRFIQMTAVDNQQTAFIYHTSSKKFYTIVKGGMYKNNYLLQTEPNGSNSIPVFNFGDELTGYNPGGLIKGKDGKIYGILQNGGSAGGGFIFKMNIDGSNYQTIYEFKDDNGQMPTGKLLYASDGRLYGVCTRSGYTGLNNNNLIFGINTDGSNYSVLKIFDILTDGAIIPELTENTAGGVLFGTTGVGGYPFAPKIFRINLIGTGYTVLRSFSNLGLEGTGDCRQALVYYNGFLYGSKFTGSAGHGLVFRIREDGTGYKVIRDFSATDGTAIINGLTLATNNKFYGTTFVGGTNGFGTIFSVNPYDSTFKVIYNFTEYGDVMCGFLEAGDGKLYTKKGIKFYVLDTVSNSVNSFQFTPFFNPSLNTNGISYLLEIPFVATNVNNITRNKINAIIFPNPVKNELNIKYNFTGRCNIVISDILGRVVYTGVLNNNLTSINIQQLKPGLYNLYIQTNKEKGAIPFIKN